MRSSGRDRFEYSTHGEHDEDKRDELRGAFGQLRDLERNLAEIQARISRAPTGERAPLAARYAEEARREAQSAREAYNWEQLRYRPYGH